VAKSLIVGGASNYRWNELKYWINSIKRSGFDGDIKLVVTNVTAETIEKLSKEGVGLCIYGKKQEDGSFKSQTNVPPHVERFFYIWDAINSIKDDYEYIITTDTRDVVFQTNPVDWLKNNLNGKSLVASSEGLRYEDEPWGNQNLLETFGAYFHEKMKHNIIFNVGTIAGEAEAVSDLILMIFQTSINRPIPIVDQAAYNFLIHRRPIKDNVYFTNNKNSWAIQLGTTLEAVKSGKGDLGMIYGSDPSKHINYQLLYKDDQPIFENGFVYDQKGKKYCIVHQYDRTLEWTKKIMEKYDD
jgi:hypothetical protein